MKPRIVVSITGAIAIVAVGVGLLLLAPWKSSEQVPAIAAYGLCNVSMGSVPTGVTALAFPSPQPDEVYKLMLVLETPRDPKVKSITDPNGRSHVAVDPSSGEIVHEFYRSAADREALQRTLDGLHVGPWQLADPSDAVELPESWSC
jgi:hypothetical protein